MNFALIDIEKSIEKEKLIPKCLFERFFEYFGFLIILGYFPFIFGILVNAELERKEVLGLSIILFIIAISLSVLLYKKSIKNIYKLLRITALSPDKNREIIRSIVKNENWNTYFDNKEIFSFGPKRGFSWTHRREVTILYDNNDLLINSMSFGTRGLVSPFHWIEDRRVEKFIAQKIEEEIKATTNK